MKKPVFMLKAFYPFPTVRGIYTLPSQIYFPPFTTLLCSLGGWPLWLTAAQLPCPLASSWLQTLESTSKEIRAGGKKCQCLLGHGWQSLPLLYSLALGHSFSFLLSSCLAPWSFPQLLTPGGSHHLLLDSLHFAHTFIVLITLIEYITFF